MPWISVNRICGLASLAHQYDTRVRRAESHTFVEAHKFGSAIQFDELDVPHRRMREHLVNDPSAQPTAAAICSHNDVEDKRACGLVRQHARKRDKPIVGLVAKADRHIRPVQNGARLVDRAGARPPFMFVELHELVDAIATDRVDNAVSWGHQPLSAGPPV